MYYCFKGCDEACQGMGTCLGACCFPEGRPSAVFPWFALSVNAIVGGVGVWKVLAGDFTDCDEPVKMMIILAVAAAVLHIFFSMYFWKRLDVVMHRGQDTDTEALRLMKYDYGVFVYMVACIANGVFFVMSAVQHGSESVCNSEAGTSFFLWVLLAVYISILAVIACLGAATTSVWEGFTGSGNGYRPASTAPPNTATTTTRITFISNPFQRFFGAPSPAPARGGGGARAAAPPPRPPPTAPAAVNYSTMAPPPEPTYASNNVAPAAVVAPPPPPADQNYPSQPAVDRTEAAAAVGWQGAPQQPQW